MTVEKAEKKNSKVGRKTKYKKEYDELAFNYSLLGATDVEMASFFEVSERTLNTWKNDHESFLQSLKAGKEEADGHIAKALYHRAKGYSCPEEKVVMVDGQPETVEITKHYPPDTAAAVVWLGNRQGGRWKRDPSGAPPSTGVTKEELLETIANGLPD